MEVTQPRATTMSTNPTSTNGNDTTPLKGAARLRHLLSNENKIIVAPGIYDGFTARLAMRAGFDCLYMTGAGTTMSRLGMADLGIATLNDMRENAAMIASLDQSVPLIADADTGYGGPLQVGRTVAQYIQSGVAALHLEDQVLNKRCGHLANKQLVPPDVFHARIRAAVNARRASGSDIVLIARTDALASLGLQKAIERLKKAIEIGADVAFLEGITSKQEAETVISELKPTSVLFNMAHGGVTPSISAQEAQEWGFKIIIFPSLALNEVYKSVTNAFSKLKAEGEVKYDQKSGDPSLKEMFAVCGLEDAMAFDREAGGDMYTDGA